MSHLTYRAGAEELTKTTLVLQFTIISERLHIIGTPLHFNLKCMCLSVSTSGNMALDNALVLREVNGMTLHAMYTMMYRIVLANTMDLV